MVCPKIPFFLNFWNASYFQNFFLVSLILIFIDILWSYWFIGLAFCWYDNKNYNSNSNNINDDNNNSDSNDNNRVGQVA